MAEVDSRESFPGPGLGDRLHSGGRAVLAAAVPVLGAPAAELMTNVLTPPLERRRTAWFNNLAERLERLEEQVESFTVASLRDDEEFITAVMTASQIAIRNHSGQKIEWLQNAVANVALKTEADIELQSLFLTFIEYFAPVHIRLLMLFQNPQTYASKLGHDLAARFQRGSSAPLRHVLEEVLLDMSVMPDRGFLVDDLDGRGLIRISQSSLSESITNGMITHGSLTTELGDRLLRFIREQ